MKEESQYRIFIDTADRNNRSVVLKLNEKVIDAITGDIDIISSVRDILKNNNLTLQQVLLFIPNLGPGSFTGLKMGVTDANILNWALKRKSDNLPFYPEYGREANISEPKKRKF